MKKTVDWKKLARQAGQFLLVSGTGWALDFGVFLLLTRLAGLPVAYSNMLSAVPAVSFVFLVSTRKIFANKKGRVPLVAKYAIWLCYQLILVVCVSFVAQWLFNWASGTALGAVAWLAPHLGLLAKVAITPFTMTANFFAMRFLSEKL